MKRHYLPIHAEWTEAGPGPEAGCQQNRSDTGTGPRGDVASHFVGLLVLIGRKKKQINRRDAESLRCAFDAGAASGVTPPKNNF